MEIIAENLPESKRISLTVQTDKKNWER